MSSTIVGTVVLILVVLAVKYYIKQRKSGCSGCCRNCRKKNKL